MVREYNESSDIIKRKVNSTPLSRYTRGLVISSHSQRTSHKGSAMHIRNYHHVNFVEPPSLIENSQQMSMLRNSNKINQLISARIRLNDTLQTIPDSSSLPTLNTSSFHSRPHPHPSSVLSVDHSSGIHSLENSEVLSGLHKGIGIHPLQSGSGI